MFGLFRRPPPWFLVATAVVINVMWASCYPLTKMLLATLSPLALTVWRSAITAVVLVPLLKKSDFPARWWRGRDLVLLSVMGLVGCALASILQYLGTSYTLSANVGLITSLEPLVTNVLAIAVLGERLGRRQLIGFALAMPGIYLISVGPGGLDMFSIRYLLGNFLILLAVVAYALYTIAAKPLVGRMGTRAITALPFLMTAAVCLPVLVLTDPAGFKRALMLTPVEVGQVVYISLFSTVIVYMLWNWLLCHISVSRLSYSIFVQPPAGALFSVLLLGESLSGQFYGGTILIIGAVLVSELRLPLLRPEREEGTS